MDEWTHYLTQTPQGQFIVGVLVLIFGSRAVLSEENLKGKLSGLTLPGRWLRRRQQRAAEREVTETKRLRNLATRQHRYILWLTSIIRSWEIDAADKGHKFPPPEFLTYLEWVAEHYPEDDNH